MTNAELIKALRYCISDEYVEKGCLICPICAPRQGEMKCNSQDDAIKYAAAALEAADKRIAELEAKMPKMPDRQEFLAKGSFIEEPLSRPKEGEWIFSRGDGKTYSDGWTCSACGNSFHTHVPYFEEFHFCPNCGARMKGEEK